MEVFIKRGLMEDVEIKVIREGVGEVEDDVKEDEEEEKKWGWT